MTITIERYEDAYRFEEFLSEVEKHEALWHGIYDHFEVPDDALKRLNDLPGRRRVLVLAEDWCGDAASLVPILAKVAASSSRKLDLRVLERDENLDIMDRHLSHGGRSIPIAIVFDEGLRGLGWWGPRPAPAQALFRERIRAYRDGELEDKGVDVYRPILKWYREDRGRHTVDEFLMLLERGGVVRE